MDEWMPKYYVAEMKALSRLADRVGDGWMDENEKDEDACLEGGFLNSIDFHGAYACCSKMLNHHKNP